MRRSAPDRPPAPPDSAAGRRGRHTSPVRVVRRPAAAAVLIAGLLVAGCAAARLAVASQSGRPAASAGPVSPTKFVPIPKGTYAAAPPAASQQVAGPVSIVIPAIGVRARIVHLGTTAAGTLQVPRTVTVAGWFTGSPRPGQPGGAVIAGHIDSKQTFGVFYKLGQLHAGERVYVRRADGTLAVFQVTTVRSYLKVKFPTNAVYGPTPDAQLRLITCGGTFDWATGHYLSNTIVYATLVP